MAFSKKGVHIKAANVDFFIAWENFRKAGDAMRCFLLYVNSSMYYTLPKRCLPDDQRIAVRELIKSKLAIT